MLPRPVSTGIAAVVATRSTQRRVVAFHPDPPIEIDAHAVAFSSVVAFSSLRIRTLGIDQVQEMLARPVQLFDVWPTGQDETVHADIAIRRQSLRHFLVASDEADTVLVADAVESGPQDAATIDLECRGIGFSQLPFDASPGFVGCFPRDDRDAQDLLDGPAEFGCSGRRGW